MHLTVNVAYGSLTIHAWNVGQLSNHLWCTSSDTRTKRCYVAQTICSDEQRWHSYRSALSLSVHWWFRISGGDIVPDIPLHFPLTFSCPSESFTLSPLSFIAVYCLSLPCKSWLRALTKSSNHGPTALVGHQRPKNSSVAPLNVKWLMPESLHWSNASHGGDGGTQITAMESSWWHFNT